MQKNKQDMCLYMHKDGWLLDETNKRRQEKCKKKSKDDHKKRYTSNEKTVSNDKSFSSLDSVHKIDPNEKCKVVKGHVPLYLSF